MEALVYVKTTYDEQKKLIAHRVIPLQLHQIQQQVDNRYTMNVLEAMKLDILYKYTLAITHYYIPYDGHHHLLDTLVVHWYSQEIM